MDRVPWKFFLVAFGIPWLLFPLMYVYGVGLFALIMMFAPALGVLVQGDVYRPEFKLKSLVAFFYPLLWLAVVIAITAIFISPQGPEAGIKFLLTKEFELLNLHMPEEVLNTMAKD
jgi:uncharacterized RDD family membrane protein YckC